MTLVEVSQLLGRHLQVNPCTDTLGGFYASLGGVEISHGACLTSPTGFGATRAEARKGLAARITGERLLLHAYSHKKREFNLTNITVTTR
jgi:hypothetical protein